MTPPPEWTPPYATITPTERRWFETRAPWEYQLFDERGELVWNLDLAKRYRDELSAYREGDFSHRRTRRRRRI